MKQPRAGWSLIAEDLQQLNALLGSFAHAISARSVLLVDRNGQLLTVAGEAASFDSTTFASLAAADFAASDQLAKLLGEDEFASLYHQGERDSMYLVDVDGHAILAALFGEGTTLGLVRMRARTLVPEIATLFETVSARGETGEREYFDSGWLSEAESEIDRLFAD